MRRAGTLEAGGISQFGVLEIRGKLSEFARKGVLDRRILDVLAGDQGFAPVESEILDYKRSVALDAAGLAKLAVDIVSLHNTFGGYLVVGVEEVSRDQVFKPLGFPAGTIKLQQIKTIIQNYTGRSIDVRFADIPLASDGSEINLGVFFVPKRTGGMAPVKFGKPGPVVKNGTPLFSVDDVFFRVLDSNARAKASEDWWFLASERNATLSPAALAVPVVGLQKQIVDENLPDRNLICPRFVGRDDKILSLWQWLSDDLQFAKVLAGDGGKGKTSIAYQFAEEVCRSKPFNFEKVIWLTAKSLQFRGLTDEYDPVAAHYASYDELLSQLCEKMPILTGEIEGSSPHLLKQHLRHAFEEVHTFVVIDDVDSLSIDEQRMVLETALQIGNRRSRFLLTTRKNFTYSADLCLVVNGFELDDYIKYVHEFNARLGIEPLSIPAIEKLRKATDGSPLYTESLLRLIRNHMRLDEAISRWKGELGIRVRRAALDREVENLSLESRRVLLAAVYLFECSYTELRQATGYDDERLMQCIDELKAIFLLGAPRVIQKEARFSVQSNTRSLVLHYERTLVTDFESLRRKCQKVRSGARGITKTGNKRQVATAITQANAFLREKAWEDALDTVRAAMKRSPKDADLLFVLGKAYLAKEPPDYTAAKKALKESYDQGQRRYQLYATWYECEFESSHYPGAIEVASLALRDEITERHEWLIARAVGYKASSQIREKGGDFEGAIEDLRSCHEDLRVAWPLQNKNQADEVFASLLSVGESLIELAVRHASSVPDWVKVLDILQRIVFPPDRSAEIASRMVDAVKHIAGDILQVDDPTIRQVNLIEGCLRDARAFIASNRTSANSKIFAESEEELSAISSRLAKVQEAEGPFTPSPSPTRGSEGFDVFLAHNAQDKPAVRRIAGRLQAKGVSVWLDEKEIPPGQLFQDYIQKALPSAKTVVVIVGPSGLGRWQALEMRIAISRAVEVGIPVIPVFLPNAKDVRGDLPFLMEFNHVRLKSLDDDEAIDRIAWGARLGRAGRHIEQGESDD